MKSFKFVALFTLALTLTSCFEVIEEFDLSADGSGSYEYTLNMSQSRTRLDQTMLLDSINGHKVPQKEDLKKPISELESRATAAKGISGIQVNEDYENYIFSFKCEFSSVSALNALVNSIQKDNKEVPGNQVLEHFTYDSSTGVFKRNGSYSLKDMYSQMRKTDRAVLEGATFTSIFRTEKEISSYSNQQSKISPSKKALMLKIGVMDMVSGDQNMGNEIQIK